MRIGHFSNLSSWSGLGVWRRVPLSSLLFLAVTTHLALGVLYRPMKECIPTPLHHSCTWLHTAKKVDISTFRRHHQHPAQKFGLTPRCQVRNTCHTGIPAAKAYIWRTISPPRFASQRGAGPGANLSPSQLVGAFETGLLLTPWAGPRLSSLPSARSSTGAFLWSVICIGVSRCHATERGWVGPAVYGVLLIT